MLVRVPGARAAALAAALHAAAGVRTARKAAEPVRIQIDPLGPLLSGRCGGTGGCGLVAPAAGGRRRRLLPVAPRCPARTGGSIARHAGAYGDSRSSWRCPSGSADDGATPSVRRGNR